MVANSDKLLHTLAGCGEQNMLNFLADIEVLNYLNSSNSLVDAVKSKALRFLESGYQRQLTYKHPDGSYSASGTSDPRGSTRLTAFTVRSFTTAQPHIYIDQDFSIKALDFLAKQQMKNGKVVSSGMYGGSASSGVKMENAKLETYSAPYSQCS